MDDPSGCADLPINQPVPLGRLRPDAAQSTLPRLLAAFVAAYFLSYLVYAIAQHQQLYADGAVYLLRVAASRFFVVRNPPRLATILLFQWPAVLGTRLGVTDLRTLSYLLGIGYHYLAVLTLFAAWYLLPRQRKELMLYPIASILLGWMGSCFAVVVEGNALALWFWPLLFALLFRPLANRRDLTLLAGLALPMIALYESVVLIGPLLAAVAIWRWRGHGRHSYRWMWLAIALWLLAAALLAAYFIIVPEYPANRANFVSTLEMGTFVQGLGWSQINWPVALALMSIPLCALAMWRPRAARASMALWLPLFGLLAGFVALAPILSIATFAPYLQFMCRSFASLIPAVLAVPMVLTSRLPWPRGEASRWLLAAIVSLVATAQITWHVVATAQWAGYLESFRGTLESRRGLVSYNDTLLSRPAIGLQVLGPFNWPWTNPWLSIALAPGNRVASIVGNPGRRDANGIDPRRADGLPQIPGVDYAAYLAALAEGSPHSPP